MARLLLFVWHRNIFHEPEKVSEMSNDIALSRTQRSNLLSLRRTQALADRTQERLTSGKKVNSVVDNAINFFRARSLTDRAEDFQLVLEDVQQGIRAVQTALDAMDSISTLISQMRGIVFQAKSATKQERQAFNEQFRDVIEQINFLVDDASYHGLTLLNNTQNKLDVSFGVLTQSKLMVEGLQFNRTNVGAGNVSSSLFSVNVYGRDTNGRLAVRLSNLISGGSFTTVGTLSSAISVANAADRIIRLAEERLRGQASTMGVNVAILQVRFNFTESYVNQLATGSDSLTLADLNEEGANLVALQTRQQLGLQSLAVSGQQQQAILTLLQ